MSDAPKAPPGWYPSPEVEGVEQWWDGERWTSRSKLEGKPETTAPVPPHRPPPLPMTPAPDSNAGRGADQKIVTLFGVGLLFLVFGQVVDATEGSSSSLGDSGSSEGMPFFVIGGVLIAMALLAWTIRLARRD